MNTKDRSTHPLMPRILRGLAGVQLALLATAAAALPGRSTSIALTPGQNGVVAVNHDAGSVSVFAAEDGAPGLRRLAEVAVGVEPNCVAIHPSGSEAYVTTSDGYVAVVALGGGRRHTVSRRIRVGNEPRGCAITPNGSFLYVANHTDGTVSVISPATKKVVATAPARFGRPYAVAITDDGDGSDDDETVFVTDFYARRIADGPGEGFDNGKQGVVRAFPVGDFNFISEIVLSPQADSGFTADRSAFCPQSAPNPAALASNIFCPDTTVAANDPKITADPQGAFPNQLHAAVIRAGGLYLPSIGAAPEPPVKFNVNVQGLVHVVNTAQLREIKARTVNLNAQIKLETDPANPTASLARLFAGDLVAVDAYDGGNRFAFVSRGGNYVLLARLVDNLLSIDAPSQVVRLQTGHTPTGIAVTADGTRAYVVNEVGRSVSVLNLIAGTVIARDVESSAAPLPGTQEHKIALGKLVFFTSLGVPDNGLVKLPLRSIDPLLFRGKQSDNGWSSCASCHAGGLSDSVTWIFADGPRQSIPLDGTYSKLNPAHDARILNWSAVRGSNNDFNNNSRGVQGGRGFASDPPFSAVAPNPNIFNHGITHGASQALDLETLWLQTVRPLNMPTGGAAAAAGAAVFEAHCASCHGGAKWTKSEILYADNPALVSGVPRDAGVTLAPSGGGQIQSYASVQGVLAFLEDVDTFNGSSSREIKANGTRALGADGFNVPSLLGVGATAPYFHNGGAETFDDVFRVHALGGGSIRSELSAGDRRVLEAFLRSIDGDSDPLRSEGDEFRDPF